jgi:chromatin remodeling complex protein RSC6
MSKVTTTKTKTTKKVSKTKEVPVVEETPAPVVEEPAPVPEPVVEEPAAPVEETPAPVVEETPAAPVEEVAAPVVEEVTMRQRFDLLIKSRTDLINTLKAEVQELKKMQRDHDVMLKEASKKLKKKKAPRDDGVVRKPSGFASPVVVSDELYAFLAQFGVKHGDLVARTDVTRYVTSYIKEHNLQNPEHRREIVPDDSLKSLFGPPMEPKDPNDANSPLIYTYLKMQRYLSSHFPKKSAQ